MQDIKMRDYVDEEIVNALIYRIAFDYHNGLVLNKKDILVLTDDFELIEKYINNHEIIEFIDDAAFVNIKFFEFNDLTTNIKIHFLEEAEIYLNYAYQVIRESTDYSDSDERYEWIAKRIENADKELAAKLLYHPSSCFDKVAFCAAKITQLCDYKINIEENNNKYNNIMKSRDNGYHKDLKFMN